MKTWYTSKTLWINLITVIAMIVQSQLGYVISPELQAYLLALINLILRAVTGTSLGWKADATPPDDSMPTIGGPPTGEAGFINLRCLVELFLIGMLLALLAACATTSGSNPTPLQTAGKSLLAVKSTIVTAATAADALCKTGTLPTDKCTQAKAAYEMSKPAYDAAVDAYLLMSSQGGDAADFGAALVRVQGIAQNLLLISSEDGQSQELPIQTGGAK